MPESINQSEITEPILPTPLIVVPNPNALTRSDIKKWGYETFFFSIPFLIAVLNALSSGHDWGFALGAGYGALATSLMNLYGKYKGS